MIGSTRVPSYDKEVFNVMSLQCPVFLEVLNSKKIKIGHDLGQRCPGLQQSKMCPAQHIAYMAPMC